MLRDLDRKDAGLPPKPPPEFVALLVAAIVEYPTEFLAALRIAEKGVTKPCPKGNAPSRNGCKNT
jgi:hypothetical protein